MQWSPLVFASLGIVRIAWLQNILGSMLWFSFPFFQYQLNKISFLLQPQKAWIIESNNVIKTISHLKSGMNLMLKSAPCETFIGQGIIKQ